jgi:hypothetical protein
MEGAPSLSGRRSSARSAAVCLRRMSKLKTFLSYCRKYVHPIPIPIPIPVLFVASRIPIPSAVPQPRSRAQSLHPSSPVQTSLHDRRKRSLQTSASLQRTQLLLRATTPFPCPIIPSSVPEREPGLSGCRAAELQLTARRSPRAHIHSGNRRWATGSIEARNGPVRQVCRGWMVDGLYARTVNIVVLDSPTRALGTVPWYILYI